MPETAFSSVKMGRNIRECRATRGNHSVDPYAGHPCRIVTDGLNRDKAGNKNGPSGKEGPCFEEREAQRNVIVNVWPSTVTVKVLSQSPLPKSMVRVERFPDVIDTVPWVMKGQPQLTWSALMIATV